MAHAQAVFALHGRRTNILVIAVGLVRPISVMDKRPSRGSERIAHGTDRPGWFLDQQIQVALAVPFQADNQIEFLGLAHRLLKLQRLGNLPVLHQLRNGIGGRLFGTAPDWLTLFSPSVCQNLRGAPDHGVRISGTARQIQSIDERLGTIRTQMGRLAVEFNRAIVTLKAGEIRRQSHHRISVPADQILVGHQDTFDVAFRTARGLHGERQRFMHPRRNDFSADDCLLQTGNDLVVLLALHKVGDKFLNGRFSHLPGFELFAPAFGPLSTSLSSLVGRHRVARNRRSGRGRWWHLPLRCWFFSRPCGLINLGDQRFCFFFNGSG